MVAPLVLAGAGAALGGLSSLFGSNKPQETTQSLDPESQNYIRAMRGMAQNFAGQRMGPMDPAFLQALSQIQGFGGMGLDAMRAMGDPSQMMSQMNPYLAAMNPMYDQMRAATSNDYNKRIAGAQAFGARRFLGPDFSQVNNLQSSNAMNAFESLRSNLLARAGLGFSASQAAGGMGQYLSERQRNWDMGSLQMLQSSYGQPLYTKSSTPTEKPGLFQSMLGGAMTGLSFAGGPKAAPAAAASFLPGYVPGGNPMQFPQFGEGFRLPGPTGFGQGY